MSTPVDVSGQQLVSDQDHLQLSRLVVEAAWRVDLGRSDTLHELFVPDGELDLGETTMRGSEQIRDWGRRVEAANTYPGIRHVAGNMRFVATGADTAEGTTMLTVFMDNDGDWATSVPWVVGEDHDRFVRTPAGWRFAHRAWVQLFTRG
jgi:hypothetical protein